MPTIIHVTLDTTAFRQDPVCKKAAFQALADLTKTDKLTLHIPYIVRNEFLGHIADQHLENLSKLSTILAKLSRLDLPKSVRKTIISFQSKSTTFTAKNITHLEQEFDKWANDIKAIVYPLKSRNAHSVLKGYFSGTPPFSGRRVRNDIPDAFIFEDIKSLVKAHHSLNVISGDQNLRSACLALNNLKVYSTLDDFIKSKQCQKLLKDKGFEAQLPNIKAHLAQYETYLQNALDKKLVDALAWKAEIKDEGIPSDDHTAYISSAGDSEQLEIYYDDLEYLGGGTLILEFRCKVEVGLDYHIFKGDYHLLPENEADAISVSEYDNRHYFSAEEDRVVEVEGVFSCTLDVSNVTDGENIADSLEDLVDDAEIEVEKINSVRVLPRQEVSIDREPF